VLNASTRLPRSVKILHTGALTVAGPPPSTMPPVGAASSLRAAVPGPIAECLARP